MMLRRLTVFLLAIVASLSALAAWPNESSVKTSKPQQIVVRIHKSRKGLIYVVKSFQLKKGDANFLLAEMKLRECSDCQIVAVLDDDIELSAISQIGEMSINAGFKDVRPFIYWRNSGRIAEIQFGPVMKLTENPPTL
jgi:hypothetical protein